MTLLHYLNAKQTQFGFSLSAVHCEHGIRGEESLQDLRFVERACKEWNIPLFIFSEDCPKKALEEKLSLETAARNFRYTSFSKLLSEDKADYIATAHHADDEAETVLFRLSRGTSLSGVKGIQEENGKIIRPLIDWTRAEIENYTKEYHIEYRTDKTNFERDATRNILRLDVLPKLNEAIGGASKNLVRFAGLAAEDDALLYEYAETLVSYSFDKEERIEVAFCDRKPIFRRACLMAMKYLGIEKDYTTAHLDALYYLQRKERGAKISLPQNIQAEKTSNALIFYERKEEIFEPLSAIEKFSEKGFDGGRYEVKCFFAPVEEKNEFKILRIDMDKIPKTAVFRFREEGDEIERFGGGRKTLKKFFNEEKTPVEERGYLPLIAEPNGKEVYVVCGVEISEKVKVDETTKRPVYIQLSKKRS